MSLAKNLTYKCPNNKHNKTARRYKHDNAPICPICGKEMIVVYLKHKKSKSQKRHEKLMKDVTICPYKY